MIEEICFMTLVNHNKICIAGRYFACVGDLEEYCFENPEFEEEVKLSEYLHCVWEDMDAYFKAIYLECGDDVQ